jgi:exosortase A-associated hydrolase 2
MEAFFLPAHPGQRLCIHHEPACPTRGAVLYVPPWAEEMNKARRMAALQSRAMAAAGFAVLQLDLHGCGDSSGEFADATWPGWLADIGAAVHWLQVRYESPLWLWGLRTGALLAAQAAEQLPGPCHLLLWQPLLAGKQGLQQFLRLKAAAELQQGDATATLERARADLAAGRCVEVAGYTLPPALAQGLSAATLELSPRSGHVLWFELSTREPATLLPASQVRLEAWRAEGRPVQAQAVQGPAFWQTQEIEDAPALITATTAALLAAQAPAPAA